MFLFLSKLLPLFIYPLGLACVLLLISLLTVWHRPRLSAVFVALALAALLLGGNSQISTWVVRSLEWQHIPTEVPSAEAIVVLGGGIKPEFSPRPWIDLAEAGDRVIYGARLFREGKAPVVILSGGRIGWKGGGPPESADMAKLAEALGVPAAAILQDQTSLNTYENAVNVQRILQERGIRRILLVTSAMHMPRSLRIFQKQGIEAIAAPTDFIVTEQEVRELDGSPQAIALNLIPDADSLQQLTRALKEYVGTFIYRLRGWL
ncbi:YdcF family protein [Oculatella sp. LEGE 06141]|uniref:YdcF family protein n=1 Tax=Oculatella sp. LEGE 06141 TaxID=1828648 RepID=UPI00187E8833|nr:YdcF family protein [Oculatella sp. LEGE 06141]MBE9177378.1 YdcF family protein [Oculatella sp. LEGE 06141]